MRGRRRIREGNYEKKGDISVVGIKKQSDGAENNRGKGKRRGKRPEKK